MSGVGFGENALSKKFGAWLKKDRKIEVKGIPVTLTDPGPKAVLLGKKLEAAIGDKQMPQAEFSEESLWFVENSEILALMWQFIGLCIPELQGLDPAQIELPVLIQLYTECAKFYQSIYASTGS